MTNEKQLVKSYCIIDECDHATSHTECEAMTGDCSCRQYDLYQKITSLEAENEKLKNAMKSPDWYQRINISQQLQAENARLKEYNANKESSMIEDLNHTLNEKNVEITRLSEIIEKKGIGWHRRKTKQLKDKLASVRDEIESGCEGCEGRLTRKLSLVQGLFEKLFLIEDGEIHERNHAGLTLLTEVLTRDDTRLIAELLGGDD
jgi:hypothetical protein